MSVLHHSTKKISLEMAKSEDIQTLPIPQNNNEYTLNFASCPFDSRNTFFVLKKMFDCTSSNLEPYHCKNCNRNFNTTIHLKKHSLQENGTHYEKSYMCKSCPFESFSLLLYFKHLTNKCSATKPWITGTNQKIFKCDSCGFHTNYKQSLLRHQRTKHTYPKSENWFKCESCFHITQNAKHHCDMFQCDECDFTTKWNTCLLRHKMAKHVRNKVWFNCNECIYKSTQKSDVTRHFASKHTDDKDKKWYTCEQCSFKTIIRFRLNDHILSKHTQDKDKKWFQCYKCAYKTAGKVNLKRHLKVKHENPKEIKWYECDQCSFTTIWEGRLSKHKLKNHKIKEWFKCDQCYYKTTGRGQMKRHLNAKHVYGKSQSWM